MGTRHWPYHAEVRRGGTNPTYHRRECFVVNLTIYFAQSLESGDNMTNVPQNVPQETSANEPINEPKDEPIKPSERQQIILDYLSHNPDASKEKMSQKLKISLATLKREIDALKNLGALVREGGLKSGKWVVLKQ